MSTPIQPIAITQDDLTGWNVNGEIWQHKVARWWATYMPRAKGWMPRFIGRHFCAGARDTATTASGARLAIDFDSLDAYCAIERDSGLWESRVLEICCQWLKPGAIFYDIGANVGFMSIEAARRFNDEVRVFAFEPQPSLARAIAISAALNGLSGLQVFSTLIGSRVGEADLFVPNYSIHATAMEKTAGAQAVKRPISTIDDLVGREVLPPPDVIKIDVEGAEWDVFHGAAATIAAHRPHIVFEAWLDSARFGHSRREICEYLGRLGNYKFLAVRDTGTEEIPGLMDDPTVADIAAIPV